MSLSLSRTHVTIFQPYLSEAQKKGIDPFFTPLNHMANPKPLWREYYLQQKIPILLEKNNADYIGIFSPKFEKKSLLSGCDVFNHIKKNPGYDIYLFHPSPQYHGIYYNLWDQAEAGHPGITDLTQAVLNKTNPEIVLNKIGRHTDKMVCCNYWVATPSFWQKFMAFLNPIAHEMIQNPEHYFQLTTYDFGALPFFPFIIERMVSTFLIANPEITFLPYCYSADKLDKLMYHDFQRALYEKTQPIIHNFNNLYGNDWPQSARDDLIAMRSEFSAALKMLDKTYRWE